jgi:6-phosphogluconolactonase
VELQGEVMRPERVVVEERDGFVAAAAAWVASSIAAVLAKSARCSVALSGGGTPRAIYAHLADRYVDVPWALLDIYFGDERRVPPDDPRSNYRMAREALLSRVPIAPSQVHRMEGEREDADAAARDYEEILPASLDILLLGMGGDGHTASLFPGTAQLEERDRRVVPSTSPVPPAGRLTITPPVIVAAGRVAVMVSGAEKAPAVARALEGSFDPQTLPVQFALRASWFLDRDAAARLGAVLT